MGASQRRKGHDFERKVAIAFRDAGYPEARRGLQYRDGYEVPDVIVDGFRIECKARKEHLNHHRVLAEVDQKANDGEMPLAIVKLTRQPATVTLWLDDFLMVLQGKKATRTKKKLDGFTTEEETEKHTDDDEAQSLSDPTA